MKNKNVKVYMNLADGGQEILSAYAKAGVDPTKALRSEIARRGKKLLDKSKKTRKSIGQKNLHKGGCNIR